MDANQHKYNARMEMTCSGFKIKTSIELPCRAVLR